MARLSALDTSKKLKLGFGMLFTSPDFETPDLFVAIESAPVALDHVCFRAVDSQVAYLIALKADFLGALERVMRVLSAKDASCSFGLVGTVTSPVTTLSAVFASE